MNRSKIYKIFQLMITLCLLVFMILVVRSNHAKNVTYEEMNAAVTANAQGLGSLKPGSTQDIRRYLGIDPSSCDWVIYYMGNGIMDVSELAIVKADNTDALDAAEAGIQSRLSEQITNFTGYGTDQIDLLNGAICRRIGNYYFYAVSENADQWEEVFLDLVR